MPGHDTHSKWGKIVGLLGAVVITIGFIRCLNANPQDAVVIAPGVLFGTIVGASLPDIDEPNSIPRQVLEKLGMVATPIVAIGILVIDDPVREIIVGGTATAVVERASFIPFAIAEIGVSLIIVGGLVFLSRSRTIRLASRHVRRTSTTFWRMMVTSKASV